MREALSQVHALEEITEALSKGVSARQYPKLRRAGISHEVILEVNDWFIEYHLPLPTRTELFKALMALNDLGLSHGELKPFVSLDPDRLKGLGCLFRRIRNIQECYIVVQLGCSTAAYLAAYRKKIVSP